MRPWSGQVDEADHLVLQEPGIEDHPGLLAGLHELPRHRPAGRFHDVAMAVEMAALGAMTGDPVPGIDLDFRVMAKSMSLSSFLGSLRPGFACVSSRPEP